MKRIYCKCGCKQRVNYGRNYISGHNRRGVQISKEIREKMSLVHIGKPSGRKGILHTDAAKEKMSNVKLGKYKGKDNPFYGQKHTQETKDKISKASKGRMLGYKHTDAAKEKISVGRMGMIFTDEHKRNISLNSPRLSGKNNPNYGRKASAKAKRNMSLAHIGIQAGDKHGMWNGGSSFEPYGLGWTEILKKAIRKRDNNKCRLCSKRQYKRKHHIHHIDYDKTNHNLDNLITLCHSCHMKTNSDRKYYRLLFQKMLWLCKKVA